MNFSLFYSFQSRIQNYVPQTTTPPVHADQDIILLADLISLREREAHKKCLKTKQYN